MNSYHRAYQGISAIYQVFFACRVTSLEDLSFSLAKLTAAMRHSIGGGKLADVLCWPYAFSHLKQPPDPQKLDTRGMTGVPAEARVTQGTETASDAAHELAQEWVQLILDRTTHLICTLHQASLVSFLARVILQVLNLKAAYCTLIDSRKEGFSPDDESFAHENATLVLSFEAVHPFTLTHTDL